MSPSVKKRNTRATAGADVQPGRAVVVWRGGHVIEPTELREEEALLIWREVLHVGRAIAALLTAKVNYQILKRHTPHLHAIVATRRDVDDVAPHTTPELVCRALENHAVGMASTCSVA